MNPSNKLHSPLKICFKNKNLKCLKLKCKEVRFTLRGETDMVCGQGRTR